MKTWAIFKKEGKSFLLSPSFLAVCGIVASVLSFKYPEGLWSFNNQLQMPMFNPQANNKQFNIYYSVFLGHLSILNLVLIFVVPALTMRLFAEEKKMKTYDLLLTSPVTSAQIVLGKFSAALVGVFVLMLLSLVYPITTRYFAEFQWPMLLIAALGIFLVAMVYVAVDLFCSSLTESVVIAYVLSVVLNVSLWLIGSLVQVVDGATARAVFEHISLNTHLMGLIEGTVRTSALVFFLSVAALFVFLTERVVEASRWR